MNRIVLVPAVIAFCHGSAIGQDPRVFVSGNELLEALSAYKRIEHKTKPDWITAAKASRGVGFVLGIHDSLNGKRDIQGHCVFRTPPQVTQRQLADVTLKYLEDNPQKRHLPAEQAVTAALNDAFPCP